MNARLAVYITTTELEQTLLPQPSEVNNSAHNIIRPSRPQSCDTVEVHCVSHQFVVLGYDWVSKVIQENDFRCRNNNAGELRSEYQVTK